MYFTHVVYWCIYATLSLMLTVYTLISNSITKYYFSFGLGVLFRNWKKLYLKKIGYNRWSITHKKTSYFIEDLSDCQRFKALGIINKFLLLTQQSIILFRNNNMILCHQGRQMSTIWIISNIVTSHYRLGIDLIQIILIILFIIH